MTHESYKRKFIRIFKYATHVTLILLLRFMRRPLDYYNALYFYSFMSITKTLTVQRFTNILFLFRVVTIRLATIRL